MLVTNTPWIATGHLNDITVAKPIFRNGPHRRVRRLHRARARHRRQGALGRAARGVRGGLPHPRDEVHQRGQARPDVPQAAARRRAHARPDRGRPVGADHRPRSAGAAARRAHGASTASTISRRSPARSSAAASGRCGPPSPRCPTAPTRTRSRPTGWRSPSPTTSPSRSRASASLVDYAGTSPQVDRAINCTMTYTFAMTAYALKCALLPNLPNNEGIFRCIEVTAPEGSIVNPRFPASVGGRMATGHYLPFAVFGALGPRAPGPRHRGLRLAAVEHDPDGRARQRQAPTPTCCSSTAAWAPPTATTARAPTPGRATSPTSPSS